MSIRETIKSFVDTGELHLLEPILDYVSPVRWIFVNDEVFKEFNPPWESDKREKNIARARQLLDQFSEGGLISVRMPPSKNTKAQLALLSDASDEIWEFRSVEPDPQIRIFGRFAEPNVFIALAIRNKPDAATDDQYFEIREKCKREWRIYFPSYNPHTGNSANDYLSTV